MEFATKRISTEPDAIAPDGSEVRVLCQVSRGGMAVFALPSHAVSRAVGAEVWLKLESLQAIGSFKERGAANKLAQLTAEERAVLSQAAPLLRRLADS